MAFSNSPYVMFGFSRTRWAGSDSTGSGDEILSKTAILRQSLYSTHDKRNAARTGASGHQRKGWDEGRTVATFRHPAVHAVAGVRWMRRFDRPRRIARARGRRRRAVRGHERPARCRALDVQREPVVLSRPRPPAAEPGAVRVARPEAGIHDARSHVLTRLRARSDRRAA